METTILIGKIAASYLLASGIGFIFSRGFYEQMMSRPDQADPLTVNLSGMVHFLLGMMVLVNHLYFGNFFQMVITALGVGLVVKGFLLIAFPRSTMKTNDTYLPVSGIFFILGGLYLGYMSYFN